MAKADTVVVTEEATGFPGDTDYEAGEWTAISEDEGSLIDFEAEGTFVGKYRGVKIVDIEGEPTTLLLFTDKNGENRSAWSNYRLDESFGPDGSKIPVGSLVKIVHHGKAELDGGRTLNRMSVYVKR